ncbi:hypothetical protein LPUS_06713 [Lasallia pustulata]|uniref:MARVEL domain-containing protein n=1 Tax=Lasallia pustulata TaxID=136370 RepID=A0A1W5D1I2_9LECA|nr:hypothetical protein LPUS_06713 [Lasallia pustulata]
MANGKISRQPSHYPPLPFHFLRLAQLLSSIIVASILYFFIHHLATEHYTVPWTFILLASVSTLTLLALLISSIFYHILTLSPKPNGAGNLFLTVLWMLGVALLLWNISGTLSHRCNIANWHNEAGIMVCRIYKALTAFAFTGMITTLLLLLLDIRTHRALTHAGTYNPMHDRDMKASSSFALAGARASSSSDPFSHRDEDLEHDIATPYKVRHTIAAEQFGYSAPTEQTTYGGGGGDLGERYGNGRGY